MPKNTIKPKVEQEPVVDLPTGYKIEQLFGSKTRARLLSLFLENQERCFYVRELTRRIDAQLNSVRRELQNLVDLGVVSEVEGKIISTESDVEPGVLKKRADKKKFYQANKSCPFFDELRSIMKKAAIMTNQSLVHELNKKGKVDLLFLTGRFIDNSDVNSDILVVGSVSAEDLQAAIKNVETAIGREVNYTHMPKDEFLYRREVKDRFVSSLLETDKVVLINKLGGDV
ncbi:MAG: hypothetical protein Q8P30_03375 [Candidatus Uhrbacteria bacterium]|nr:hypothetical protein [Candidatus Uhrbacteria bacterium]